MSAGLDAALRAMLAAAESAGLPSMNQLPVDAARAQYDAAMLLQPGLPPAVGAIENLSMPGPGSALPLRLYRPPNAASGALPVTVFFHGGGWVVGNLDSHDMACRSLCRHAASVVIAVDYRLAPEHKFPAAIDDAYAATCWVAANAAALGVDADRLAVCGDSAGGNLAAAVCVLARDMTDGPAICSQGLIYPVTDLSLSSPSMQQLGEGFRLTKDLMQWFVDHYVDGDADKRDPRASPILVDDLSGLPPARVLTAGFDPLRDEGEAYASRLSAAGVAAEHRCFDDMIHGFVAWGDLLPQTDAALSWIGEGIKEAASA